MKLFLVVAFVVTLIIATGTSIAHADEPTEAQYALVQCTGLPLDKIVAAQQEWDSRYGWEHHFTEAWQWENSYVGRNNQFGYLLGCTQILVEENRDIELTFKYKIIVPMYKWVLSR